MKVFTQSGSKRPYLNNIFQFIREHKIEYDTIIEPFAGTACFSIDIRNAKYNKYINDINPFFMLSLYELKESIWNSENFDQEEMKHINNLIDCEEFMSLGFELGLNEVMLDKHKEICNMQFTANDFMWIRYSFNEFLRHFLYSKVKTYKSTDVSELFQSGKKAWIEVTDRQIKPEFKEAADQMSEEFAPNRYSLMLSTIAFNKFAMLSLFRFNQSGYINSPCRHAESMKQISPTRYTIDDLSDDCMALLRTKISIGHFQHHIASSIENAKNSGSKNVLIFADPPYLSSDVSKNKNNATNHLNEFDAGFMRRFVRGLKKLVDKEDSINIQIIFCHESNEIFHNIISPYSQTNTFFNKDTQKNMANIGGGASETSEAAEWLYLIRKGS